jgi:hypothetical protein
MTIERYKSRKFCLSPIMAIKNKCLDCCGFNVHSSKLMNLPKIKKDRTWQYPKNQVWEIPKI